ncbi:hypothetical protein ORF047 [Pseudomonas phage M6]|uniref:hypothetical protein ORF047 n=1 Tax=Pseudomonas phage M6 TaxID=2911432 RepID=UPI000155442F|nr:hypothetical protein ORF047 [Pseudomonas phage M6]
MKELSLKAVLLIAAGFLLMTGMRLAEWAIPVPERTINLNVTQEEMEEPQNEQAPAHRPSART